MLPSTLGPRLSGRTLVCTRPWSGPRTLRRSWSRSATSSGSGRTRATSPMTMTSRWSRLGSSTPRPTTTDSWTSRTSRPRRTSRAPTKSLLFSSTLTRTGTRSRISSARCRTSSRRSRRPTRCSATVQRAASTTAPSSTRPGRSPRACSPVCIRRRRTPTATSGVVGPRGKPRRARARKGVPPAPRSLPWARRQSCRRLRTWLWRSRSLWRKRSEAA
mmetsp:Transcript_150523/g.483924  ORF Transcript_150523/g.483924 Transcript_150523/m.483924 type:complete len:217 (+) Transcript_150523:233-883(+)